MVVNHGKNLDDLMSCIKKIDGKTTICPLVNNKQSVILEASYRQGTLNSWIVKAPRKNRPLPTCFKSGQRFGSFKEVQKQLDKESIMFDSEMTSYVLCHLRTDLQKRYNKIVSKWVKIDPYYPYDISDDGKASFDVIELELTEDEFDAMMETKLAFMDTNENLFPIQKVAMSNVGTLLDCASAFKQVDDHPLGSALLLAEKLSTKTMLKVLYRSRSKRVFPVMSIIGKKYAHISQEKFFTAILSEIAGYGVYQTEEWKVSDIESVLYVKLENENHLPYTKGFMISTGDLAGQAMTVHSYVRLGNARMFLKKNSISHIGEFKESEVKNLFEGMMDSFEVFDTEYRHLASLTGTIKNEYSLGILKIIGQKRMAKVTLDSSLTNGAELLEDFINCYDSVTPEKLKYRSGRYYTSLMHNMLADFEEE